MNKMRVIPGAGVGDSSNRSGVSREIGRGFWSGDEGQQMGAECGAESIVNGRHRENEGGCCSLCVL